MAGEGVTPVSEPGVWSMRHTTFHPEADRFIALVYEDGWVRSGVDWGEWSATQEARGLRDGPEALASAAPDQLTMLITVLVRNERSSEGTLLRQCEAGLALGIVRRAGVLVGQAAD